MTEFEVFVLSWVFLGGTAWAVRKRQGTCAGNRERTPSGAAGSKYFWVGSSQSLAWCWTSDLNLFEVIVEKTSISNSGAKSSTLKRLSCLWSSCSHRTLEDGCTPGPSRRLPNKSGKSKFVESVAPCLVTLEGAVPGVWEFPSYNTIQTPHWSLKWQKQY